MKLVLALALMITSSSFAFAEETNQEALNEAFDEAVVRTESPLAHSRRVFMGCMDTELDCEDVAHDRGYRNHGLRHNDFRCHHDHHPHACYAWR